MKYLTVLLIVLASINCISQDTTKMKIYLENKILFNKSSNTDFKNYNAILFWKNKNKYIKLKIFSNLEINKSLITNFKVNIIDSNNNIVRFNTFSIGNRDMSIGNNVKIKYKIPKYPHIRLIKKRATFFIVKFPIRYLFKTEVSSAAMGYRLKKGKYNINVEYLYNNVLYKSNSIALMIN